MADPIGHVISKIHDAALDPRLWTNVLQAVTEVVGAIGAAYIVKNARTDRVEWANFLGPSAKYTRDYITRFAAQDRFIEHLTKSEGTWMRLSEQLPTPELQRNEWYNDFVLKSGVRDIVATQISTTGSHRVIFGVYEGIGEKPLPAADLKRLDQLLEPLRRAAEVQLRLRELGWRSAVLARAFDQVSTGVIVVDAHGFVIEMNGLAERVVRRGDGLVLHNGALGAARVFETAKLGAAIAAATRLGPAASSSRFLIGRHRSKHDYILAVSPLGVDLGFYSDPMALIILSTLRRDRPRRRTSRPILDCPSRRRGWRRSSCLARRWATSRPRPEPQWRRSGANCARSSRRSKLNGRPIFFSSWPEFHPRPTAKSVRRKPSAQIIYEKQNMCYTFLTRGV